MAYLVLALGVAYVVLAARATAYRLRETFGRPEYPPEWETRPWGDPGAACGHCGGDRLPVVGSGLCSFCWAVRRRLGH